MSRAASPTLIRSFAKKGRKPSRNAAAGSPVNTRAAPPRRWNDQHPSLHASSVVSGAPLTDSPQADGRASRSARCYRIGEQIAPGGADQVQRAARAAGEDGRPAAPAARYSTSAATPPTAPSTPPTSSTASG